MSSELSPLVWLAATQFLLYGVGWAACSLILRDQRAAVAHWALFMLLLGAGLVLTAFRGEPRAWWAYGGANVLLFAGFVVLRRGGEVFMKVPVRDVEHVALLLVAVAAYLAVGAGEGHASWRVLLAYGGPAWVLMRTCVVLRRPVVAEFGRPLALLLMLPLVAVMLLFGVRMVQQALDMTQSLEMHRLNGTNRNLLFGYIAAAAMYNFTFVALLMLRLVKRLQAMSLRDALTGLHNRRALDADLRREWSRMRRGGAGFALLAIDIDHFKQVNDRHGHLAGDALLTQVAQRLLGTARETDTVARVGGEEFVVVLPQTSAAGAAIAAQRVCNAVRGADFALPAGALQATISVGVAVACEADADVNDVLRRADEALYEAKRQGRDRVCVAGARRIEPALAAAVADGFVP